MSVNIKKKVIHTIIHTVNVLFFTHMIAVITVFNRIKTTKRGCGQRTVDSWPAGKQQNFVDCVLVEQKSTSNLKHMAEAGDSCMTACRVWKNTAVVFFSLPEIYVRSFTSRMFLLISEMWTLRYLNFRFWQRKDWKIWKKHSGLLEKATKCDCFP